MTKIIELAHQLGMEIAKSDEIKNLNETKSTFDSDAELQALMSEYEVDENLARKATVDFVAKLKELDFLA